MVVTMFYHCYYYMWHVIKVFKHLVQYYNVYIVVPYLKIDLFCEKTLFECKKITDLYDTKYMALFNAFQNRMFPNLKNR